MNYCLVLNHVSHASRSSSLFTHYFKQNIEPIFLTYHVTYLPHFGAYTGSFVESFHITYG